MPRAPRLRKVASLPTAALLLGLAVACGSGPSSPRQPPHLATELVIEVAPAGLEQAVVVDSARWQPTALVPAGEGAVEIEGPYRIQFRSRADRPLEMRYDLRFYDVDGFFVDRFIPFGQPLRLAAGQSALQEGTFTIRGDPEVGRFGPATMRIAARLALGP